MTDYQKITQEASNTPGVARGAYGLPSVARLGDFHELGERAAVCLAFENTRAGTVALSWVRRMA